MRVGQDDGTMESAVVVAMLALSTLAVALVSIIAVYIGFERARGAADLAALAAASSGDCATAVESTQRNGVILDACRRDEDVVTVEVHLPATPSGLLAKAGFPSEFRASARARLS